MRHAPLQFLLVPNTARRQDHPMNKQQLIRAIFIGLGVLILCT
jgi:hypothetical protein